MFSSVVGRRMRPIELTDTCSTLIHSGQPLGVACTRCARRILLTARQLEAHESDRRALHRLPLLCRCGSRDVSLYLLETPDEGPAFLSGHTPQVYDGQGDGNIWVPSFS